MKTRVNFLLSNEIYQMVSDIAKAEESSSADIFRQAIKNYIYEYRSKDINKFYKTNNKNMQSIADQENSDVR